MDAKISNQVIFYSLQPVKNKKPDVLKRTTGFFLYRILQKKFRKKSPTLAEKLGRNLSCWRTKHTMRKLHSAKVEFSVDNFVHI